MSNEADEIARVRRAWAVIDAWTHEHAPSVFGDLNPPASEAQIVEAERSLAVRLPPAFRASLLVHDGQSRDGPALTPTGCLLSLATIVNEWNVWKNLLDGGDFDDAGGEPTGPVKARWWSPLWVPITYDGAGNHECLDFDPADGGRMGQVIQMFHDEGTRTLTAESYASWLDALAERLRDGALVWSEDHGSIVRAEDA
jgi:cell wall assembly regulator SMI1